MKYKYALIVVLIIFELLAIRQWMTCSNFNDLYHFSQYDLQLQLEDAIHTDHNIPFFIIRLFHNKLVLGTFYFLKLYLRYFDVLFLVPLLSFFGVFAFIMGIWYMVKEKWRMWKLAISLWVVLFPFIAVLFKLPVPSRAQIIVLAIPYQVLSLIGYFYFIKSNKLFMVSIVSTIFFLLSIGWFMTFPHSLLQFCSQVVQ